jgi:hypothetical protein
MNFPLENTHFLTDISGQFDWSKIAATYDRTFLNLIVANSQSDQVL